MIHKIYAKNGLGVQNDPANFDLVLISYGDLDGSGLDVKIRIPVEGVAAFLRDVTAASTYAMRDAAVSMALGECETCQNTRMVEESKNGRSRRVHCPDCRGGDEPVGFADAPTVGPKVKA